MIYDRKDFVKDKNFDPKFSENMMQNYRDTFWNIYLPYIDSVYILHIDWFLRFFFGIIRVFLPSKFSGIPKLLQGESDLIEHFDEDCLLKCYGGTSDFTF